MTLRLDKQSVALARIQTALKKPMALFLDFDGTLVPVAPKPGDAWLSFSVRDLLRSLSRKIPVVIVSGRRLQDLKGRVGLRQVTYVGNHGLEIVGSGFRYQMKGAAQWRRFLKGLVPQLQNALGELPGILLEDKDYTLSLHYRLARQGIRRKALRWLIRHLKPLEDKGLIKVGLGKAAWEIRPPVRWDKGHAVLWVLRQPAFRRRWPLYIGDDVTDEDAFRAIRGRGIGILVGSASKKGSAHYTLAGPSQVYEFLKWLLGPLFEYTKMP